MARCDAHDKVMPHYACPESETFLDELEVRLLTEGMYHQASIVEITRQPEEQHHGHQEADEEEER